MKSRLTIALLSTFLLAAAAGGAVSDSDNSSIRFVAVDIYLDSAEPVAAWQFELDEQQGLMTVVGVENGSSKAFSDAPYFDRDAVQTGNADRIIVADFSLEPEEVLAAGRIRLATVHLRLSGDAKPDFQLNLVTAASADGRPVDASISIEQPTGR